MANEIRMPGGITVRKQSGSVIQIDHKPAFSPYPQDMSGSSGPTPGAIVVAPTGTDVDLSELVEPGPYEIFNQSADQTITYGIYDSERNAFYYFGEIAPGQGHSGYLSENFGERDDGVGTGTTASTVCRLRLYSETSNVSVYVGAFER